MLNFPTSFPSDAISDGIYIVTTGQVAAMLPEFARDLWNVQGYLEGTLIPTGAASANAISAEQRTSLAEFGKQIAAAHPAIKAHKLGDGTLLQLILKNLPTLLSLLKLFGVPVPTLPTT